MIWGLERKFEKEDYTGWKRRRELFEETLMIGALFCFEKLS
jgi:hypothetical protein